MKARQERPDRRVAARVLVSLVVGTMLMAPPAASAGTQSAGEVTFTRDVLPILQRACQQCHRPGSVAPMSLLTYEEVRPWARAIRDKTAQREMPPWYIERNVGVRAFKEDASLTDDEIATIGAWVDAGASRGNPADAPPPLELASLDEWRIGTPEWIVELPETQTIGAVDADHWLDVWADSRLTEDRYIKAVETKPSPDAYRVVHHVATSMRWEEEDGEEGGGFLNEYAMGKNGDIFPDGTGRLIKAGTQIRFNMHYSSVGEEIRDRTRVGFKLYPKGVVPDRVLISRHVGDSFDTLDIKAGADNVRSDGYYVLPEPTQVTGFQPHMHIRGERMCVEAIQPNGTIETLSCSGHNFGWHIVYNYADDAAPLLPAGTILHVIGWHNNTASNRYNPDPKNWVGFGNRSIDDMSFAWMSFFHLPDDVFEQKLTERKRLRSN
jgi:mono/diheme cytochrome c family protein